MSTRAASMMVRFYRSAWVQGWAVSVLVHAVLGIAVVMGLPAPPIIELRETFRWEVSLVTPPSAAPSDQAAAVPPSSSRSGASTHARPQATVVRQEVETAVRREGTVVRAVNTQSVQAVSMPTQSREAPHEQARRRTEETPVVTRVIEERTPVQQVRHEAARGEEVIVTESLRTRERVVGLVAISAERVVDQAVPVARAPAVLSQPTGLLAPASEQRMEAAGQRSAAVLAGLIPGPTEGGASQQDQAPNASETEGAEATMPADRADAVPIVPHASVVPSAPPSTMPVSQGHRPAVPPERGRAPRSDYGWLAQVLRARIEEIKGYSVEARVNEWEGKVVLVASVRADGRIEEVRIVESSGNLRLDDDARAMLVRASPLVLPKELGQSTVVVKVPIIFGLR